MVDDSETYFSFVMPRGPEDASVLISAETWIEPGA